jgi:arsenite methyltransferase
MLDFDERDLFDLTERATFEKIHLNYEAKTVPGNLEDDARDWETAPQSAPNPLAPTLGEAMAEALTGDESERFAAHLRPLVESGQRKSRHAVAYLWAVK